MKVKFVESETKGCSYCCIGADCSKTPCTPETRSDGKRGYYIKAPKPRPSKYERLLKALLADEEIFEKAEFRLNDTLRESMYRIKKEMKV